MEKIESLVRSALQTYNMIEENDVIAVGISGGKDSLVLLAALANIRKYYPVRFEIKAITADYRFGGENGDFSQISEMCRRLNVKYTVVETQLGRIIFEDRKEKNPCSLCAKMRRGILHKAAKSLGCNKIAFAHHFDDAIETFMMNLLDTGSLSCFSPVTYLSRSDITLIRPLIFCDERHIENVCKRLNLPVSKSKCPVDKTTERQKIKNLILALQKDYPDIRQKLMGAVKRSGLNGW